MKIEININAECDAHGDKFWKSEFKAKDGVVLGEQCDYFVRDEDKGAVFVLAVARIATQLFGQS